MQISVSPIIAGIPPKIESKDCKWIRLQDVARLESGHTPSRKHPEWWGGDVPWLSLTDIRSLDGGYAYSTSENINEAGLKNSSARLLPVGTVCLSRTASIGFVTVLGKSMATSQDFANWVCDEDKLNPEFLMYAFMASRKYMQELGSGAVHKTIYMPAIKSFHIFAPDIQKQGEIAKLLKKKLEISATVLEQARGLLTEAEALSEKLLAATFVSANEI